MNPIRHPSNNRTLQPPQGWNEDLQVEPLGVTDQIVEGVPCVWSFWRPDADELAALNAGGDVILSIVGRNMPPAAVMVAVPDVQLDISPNDLVRVTRHDANNYCRILRALGMEEEGDPVAEVKRLLEREAQA